MLYESQTCFYVSPHPLDSLHVHIQLLPPQPPLHIFFDSFFYSIDSLINISRMPAQNIYFSNNVAFRFSVWNIISGSFFFLKKIHMQMQ